MVGPTVAGVVAEATSWRWVFLGVVALSLAATAAMLPALRATVEQPDAGRAASRGRLALAAVVALAVVGLDLAGRSRGALGYAAAAVSLAVVLVAVRPLLPAGTLVVRRGLPAVVALRGCDRGDVLRDRDLPALPAPGALRRARLAVRRDPHGRCARAGPAPRRYRPGWVPGWHT
jgi:MFS family permease